MAFKVGTELMGATEPGQVVTRSNAKKLPPGSVVRLKDGDRLIHLHDDVWLWCCDSGWCYDHIEHLDWRLPGKLCHIPVGRE
jgi:hypothetical protein